MQDLSTNEAGLQARAVANVVEAFRSIAHHNPCG